MPTLLDLLHGATWIAAVTVTAAILYGVWALTDRAIAWWVR